MPWRRTLLALVLTAFAIVGCGVDAPAATLTTVDVYDFDGRPDTITHDDRPLVVNFFAESCPPCVAEMPAFEAVFQSVANDVVFIGVSEDATAAAGRRIVEATGVTYRTVWDADGTALEQFEALGLPTTVFVTAEGAVLDVHTGALSETTLAEMVAELIAAS